MWHSWVKIVAAAHFHMNNSFYSDRGISSYAGSLIVIPPNMLMTFFFKRSRQFIPPHKRNKIRQARRKVDAIPIDEDENDHNTIKLEDIDGKCMPPNVVK